VALAAQQRYTSPLRYPGGKGKLAGFIKLVMLENELIGREYVEPYAGGAAVALSLLYEDYASHIHINDLNRSVAAFWTAVLEHTDELCARIADTPVTVREFARQREIQAQENVSILDLAFSTLFLNRTSRSGIITGGIIGGIEQTGRWKIDARFARDDLIRRIQKVARHRSRITVTCQDAAELITTRLPGLPDAFLYLDPPYYVKGKGLYQNYYTPADHARIARLVAGIRQPWVVSYDAAADIRSLYGDYRAVEYNLSYSAQARYRGTELMFFPPGLHPPDVPSPANVSWKTVDRARMQRIAGTAAT
jgi:DNA adenine methylase